MEDKVLKELKSWLPPLFREEGGDVHACAHAQIHVVFLCIYPFMATFTLYQSYILFCCVFFFLLNDIKGLWLYIFIVFLSS